MKKIYLTEAQINHILLQEMINEGAFQYIVSRLFDGCNTERDYAKRFFTLIGAGIITASMAISMINNDATTLPESEKEELKIEVAEQAPKQEWVEICNDCVVTVYNAVPQQCNNDVKHTASMFRLDLDNVASHKIIAMERTMMQEYGLKYGDVVKIEGTHNGKQDGVFQIQDTMNKRFAGKHKVDVLVPNEVKYGGTLPDKPAKIFKLSDKENTQKYLDLMAPQAPKKQ